MKHSQSSNIRIKVNTTLKSQELHVTESDGVQVQLYLRTQNKSGNDVWSFPLRDQLPSNSSSKQLKWMFSTCNVITKISS